MKKLREIIVETHKIVHSYKKMTLNHVEATRYHLNADSSFSGWIVRNRKSGYYSDPISTRKKAIEIMISSHDDGDGD